MLIAFGDLDTFFVSGRRVIASPGLAALKEAVYQYTMAEFDPPVSIAAVRETATRLTGAARKLGISRRDSLSIGVGARRAPRGGAQHKAAPIARLGCARASTGASAG